MMRKSRFEDHQMMRMKLSRGRAQRDFVAKIGWRTVVRLRSSCYGDDNRYSRPQPKATVSRRVDLRVVVI